MLFCHNKQWCTQWGMGLVSISPPHVTEMNVADVPYLTLYFEIDSAGFKVKMYDKRLFFSRKNTQNVINQIYLNKFLGFFPSHAVQFHC